jgi:hypothetical protein
MMMLAQFVFSQASVKGVVVDKATNEPLVGVSVLQPALGIGTTTTLDGSFSLKLPEGKHELRFSYVGYSTKNVQVSSNNVNLGVVQLESEAIGLNDVTVTSSLAIRRKTLWLCLLLSLWYLRKAGYAGISRNIKIYSRCVCNQTRWWFW